MSTATPHLWFEDQAEEAAEFYSSVFPDSRILSVDKFEAAGPDGKQTATVVNFEILGQRVIGLNGGPEFKFTEAFSFFVECDSQEEVDTYWEKLTADGGEEGPCGWCKDRYGLSWQIIPKLLMDMMRDEDPAKANSVMQAMLQMKKIDCAVLRKAYDQPVSA